MSFGIPVESFIQSCRELGRRMGKAGLHRVKAMLTARVRSQEDSARRAEHEATIKGERRSLPNREAELDKVEAECDHLSNPQPTAQLAQISFKGVEQKVKIVTFSAWLAAFGLLFGGEVTLATKAAGAAGLSIVDSALSAFLIGFAASASMFGVLHWLLDAAAKAAGELWDRRMQRLAMPAVILSVLLFCLTYPTLGEPRGWDEELPSIPPLWLTTFIQIIASSISLAAAERVMRKLWAELFIVRLSREEADAMHAEASLKRSQLEQEVRDIYARMCLAEAGIAALDAAKEDLIEQGLIAFDEGVEAAERERKRKAIERKRAELETELRLLDPDDEDDEDGGVAAAVA